MGNYKPTQDEEEIDPNIGFAEKMGTQSIAQKRHLHEFQEFVIMKNNDYQRGETTQWRQRIDILGLLRHDKKQQGVGLETLNTIDPKSSQYPLATLPQER